ncbi:Xylulose kinase [Yarrowia sp. B02]|nr:Xylulose kinase [Yarrowia sp. B02]
MYLGLDLSTQQLKGIVLDKKTLDTLAQCHVDFEDDLPQFKTEKGVFHSDSVPGEINAPVAMWGAAVDLLISRLARELDLGQITYVSGSCQQHGSVYLNDSYETVFGSLESHRELSGAIEALLALPVSPNWQDASTEKECAQFEAAVGGPERLAEITGSRAHTRFTGPQILKVKERNPAVYKQTARVQLISNFLASLFAGKACPFDLADACGMNLWDIQTGQWCPELTKLITDDSHSVETLLGGVETDPKVLLGKISPYFVAKGFSKDCRVAQFTGDNPGTMLALPLKANDVIVSLGTSTTALVVTNKYMPDPGYHVFNHPMEGYMGMLCYCNGGLAREKVRDELGGWDEFNEATESTETVSSDEVHVGIYFPLREILPRAGPFEKRFIYSQKTGKLTEVQSPEDSLATEHKPQASQDQWPPQMDAAAIIQSQALSIKMRLQRMMHGDIGKVYFVGGASVNTAICSGMSAILQPTKGAWRCGLEMANACAIGSAHHAWLCDPNKQGEVKVHEEEVKYKDLDVDVLLKAFKMAEGECVDKQ